MLDLPLHRERVSRRGLEPANLRSVVTEARCRVNRGFTLDSSSEGEKRVLSPLHRRTELPD